MLLYQIYEINYASKYTSWEQKIIIIEGQLADRAHWTVSCSVKSALDTETELWIQVMQLLFDNMCFSKTIKDRTLYFTWMEVPDLIYHPLFFTANTLGHQPTTFQFF